MCIFNIKEPKKKLITYTGYKYVIIKNDKIYSPATGIEYKIGKVPILNDWKHFNFVITPWCSHHKYLDKSSIVHVPNYNGNTSVFESLKKCKKEGKEELRYETEGDIQYIKMTISGNLKEAKHTLWNRPGGAPKNTINNVIIGNYINEIILLN